MMKFWNDYFRGFIGYTISESVSLIITALDYSMTDKDSFSALSDCEILIELNPKLVSGQFSTFKQDWIKHPLVPHNWSGASRRFGLDAHIMYESPHP